MILIDTSVFIRSFLGKQPFQAAVGELLEHKLALQHEHVYGQLLLGDPGGRRAFLDQYSRFRRATQLSNSEVVHLAKERRLHGRGIGWIDAHLLGSAMVSRAPLYTADASLMEVAEKVGVLYAP